MERIVKLTDDDTREITKKVISKVFAQNKQSSEGVLENCMSKNLRSHFDKMKQDKEMVNSQINANMEAVEKIAQKIESGFNG